MHEANLYAAVAGLLEALPPVVDVLGDAPHAAASNAREVIASSRMPPL
jgi:hypothetical protein